uniref:Uncharacterized protein n=1 Tax=Arundo donax TaxID=35708 RepID=A0A0A9PAC3_ARUDO
MFTEGNTFPSEGSNSKCHGWCVCGWIGAERVRVRGGRPWPWTSRARRRCRDRHTAPRRQEVDRR